MTPQTIEAAAERRPPRMTVDDAARHVGVSVSFMNRARLTGDGPEYLKLGRRVVYERDSLDAWLASRRRRSTSSQMEAAA